MTDLFFFFLLGPTTPSHLHVALVLPVLTVSQQLHFHFPSLASFVFYFTKCSQHSYMLPVYSDYFAFAWFNLA